MPFILKVNMRHSTTGAKIRTIRKLNNFVYNKKFNSLASTFSFDYFFDPTNQESAELICVSHVHECILYYTTNTDPNYQPKESERRETCFMLRSKFRDSGKPEFVKLSGYSKAGVLNDCDIAPDQYPLEIEGLTVAQIIRKLIAPFRLNLVVDKKAGGAFKAFTAEEIEARKPHKKKDDDEEEDDQEEDDDVGKTAAESSQNIGAYISELCKQRNIVLSHNANGDVYITTPNTKGQPILTLDYSDGSNNNTLRKIPGVVVDLDFNTHALHSHITIKQQADDEEGTDGEEVTLRNPLLPVAAVYRPKTHVINIDGKASVKQAGKYELGKEIREGIPLTVEVGTVDLLGEIIKPNNTLRIRNPTIYLYTLSRWFIESVDIDYNDEVGKATMNCVLPFGYDFDLAGLKNVFVDPHENLPRF